MTVTLSEAYSKFPSMEAYSKFPSMTETAPVNCRSISAPSILEHGPSTSRNAQSLPDKQEATDRYVVTQGGLAVFDSCESWMMFRRLKEGDIVEAAGNVQVVKGFKMLPILPNGAVEMRGLSHVDECKDMGRPILLDRCLFGSSEDVFECGHFEDTSLNRPIEDFTETDDEFSFVAVTHDDFTFHHEQLPSPNMVETPGDSSDTQSSTAHESEDKAEDQKDGTPRGAQTFPERLIVRNTFIELDSDSGGDKVELNWNSCPAKIETEEFHTKYPLMEQAHIRGDCRPCAYFLNKSDGCQHGGECSFCHLCPVGALKKKKKQKVKTLKQRDYRARLYEARQTSVTLAPHQNWMPYHQNW